MTSVSRLEQLQQLAIENSGDPFPCYGLAMEFKRLGNLREAIQTFSKLIEQHPKYIPTYYQFATTLSLSGANQQARKILSNGIQMSEKQGDQHSKEELTQALKELEEK